MNILIRKFINDYIKELENALNSIDQPKIEQAIQLLTTTYKNRKRVFIIGNGGSAALASHMACDLGKGTLAGVYEKKEKRLQVMSLTDNISILTAYGNDLSFNDVFVEQLKNLAEKDDLVIVISGSGNSKNIIKAVRYAKECGVKTIGLSGFKTGGKLAQMADCSIIVQSTHYGPIEDVHLVLNHIIASYFAVVKREMDGISKYNNHAVPFKKEKT